MELNFNEKIKKLEQFKTLPSDCIIPLADVSKDYSHLTFCANSFLEYLQIIKLMNTAHEHDETLVFRGMSKSEWLSVPGLVRSENYDEFTEHTMVSEFLALKPAAFQELRSNFDILAKMQHYGLPTRLLDFTTNPLVALYFACSGHPKNEARILCCSTYPANSRDKIIESICGSYVSSCIVNLCLEEFLSNTDLTPYEYIGRVYLQRDCRPLFVKPLHWNPRIVNQSAVFLLFANTLVDHLGRLAYFGECTEDDKAVHDKIHAIAESEAVDQIYPLWEPSSKIEKQVFASFEKLSKIKGLPPMNEGYPPLRHFSTNPETMQKLFASHQHSEIIQQNSGQYTEYGETIFGRRFLLNDGIEGIDTDSMKTMFCSIIIPGKVKSEIISDLESVGIDRAFIYPEMEYTAEKIRQKYGYNA